MCEFSSWKKMPKTWNPEVTRRIFYLTKPDLDSKRGRELKKFLGPQYDNDKVGHGAIDWFYQLGGVGINKECTNFNDPNEFPPEIVADIKAGNFYGMGLPTEILTPDARAQYEAVEKPARAQFEAVEKSAWAQYKAVEKPAGAQFEAVEKPAWAQYYWAQYEAVEKPARAQYEVVRDTARAQYEAVRDPAWARKVTRIL